jgi:AraC-like DNA-binding protein
MLDPSLKWIGALDGHYHDQAQFVREFREFMGMTPRQYAQAGASDLGAHARTGGGGGRAVQALDRLAARRRPGRAADG